jgi:hypothetical protein
VESDVRYFRRRANEELAAANRAITDAARERHMQLASIFLHRLKTAEDLLTMAELADSQLASAEVAALG